MERRLFLGFFFYLVIEGALRKWLFPQAGTFLFLAKDLLLLGAFVAYLGKIVINREFVAPVLRPYEVLLVWAWIFFFCAQLLIREINISGLAGLRYYLVMLPLVMLVPRHFHYLKSFEKAVEIYLWLSVPVLLLGIVQYVSPPYALVNRYAWINDVGDVALFGFSKARITGTFSYISTFASYLQVAFILSFGLLQTTNAFLKKIFLWALIGLVFANLGMTGSRAPVLLSGLCTLPFLLPYLKSVLTRKDSLVLLLMLAVFAGMATYFSKDVFIDLWERNTMAGDAESRYMGALLWPVNTLVRSDLVGFGIGSTFMGVRELSGSNLETSFDEVASDRIGVETGIFGYLLVLVFKLVFLFGNYRLWKMAITERIKTWALVALLIQASQLWSISLYNSVSAAFYFSAVGLFVAARNEQAWMVSNWRARSTGG